MRFDSLLIFITLFISYSCGEQKERLKTDKELENKIKEQIKSGDTTLVLSKITDFNWDSLIIITPYTNSEKIENKFNINLSSTKYSGIESRDDICLLVFCNNGKTVKMIEYPRYPGDFANNKIEFIQKSNAIFNIVVTTQKTVTGDCWVELKRK